MVSLSDLYETDTSVYCTANTWLRRNAKHKPIYKGSKTYWHEDDIAAFKAREKREKWSCLIQKFFAEPTTIHDVLDALAEHGKFLELDAIKAAVYRYERKGMLKKVGREKSFRGWRALWVFVHD